MRTTILALLATASFASAQNFGGEPECASACLSSAISVAGCPLTDEACQCGSAETVIQNAVAPCFLSACNQSDLEIVASIGIGLCAKFSASLASASAATTTGASSRSIVTTTPSIPVSTSSVTAITTSVPATTSKPSSKASSSPTASSSSSAAGSASSNAAPGMIVGMGGMLGFGVAFIAAL